MKCMQVVITRDINRFVPNDLLIHKRDHFLLTSCKLGYFLTPLHPSHLYHIHMLQALCTCVKKIRNQGLISSTHRTLTNILSNIIIRFSSILHKLDTEVSFQKAMARWMDGWKKV